ncbi:MAG: RNHCP domain-containing protein [Clostridiaceae bacterium]|nr:RNHCP domain-containing protein [Eubacteriales bacterium]
MEHTRRFTMIDEPFTCRVCGREVRPLLYTARDHCPYCLCSLHVDNLPGDRMNGCGGVLRPVGVETHKGGYKLVYRCEDCGEVKRNKAASDDDVNLIIRLSANPVRW